MGIAYFICVQNDRFVVSYPKRLKAADIADYFGLSASAASVRANKIHRLFGVLNYNERCWDFLDTVDDPCHLPSTDDMMCIPKPKPAPAADAPDQSDDFSDIFDRFRAV